VSIQSQYPTPKLISFPKISVKPTNYDISITDLEFLGNWSYQGRVKIALEIKKSAKEIVLNSKALKIRSAELATEHTKTESSAKASNISYDVERQRATFAFDQEFPVAQKAILDIKFQGTINSVRMAILYS
jgi:aminopeptidase N